MHRWLSANRPILRAILSHLDTPVSLSTWLLIREKEWDQLATRWVDPLHYPEGIFSALRYRKDVQAVDLLRKAPLPTTFSRRSAAVAAWEHAETQCFVTNRFLSSLRESEQNSAPQHLANFLCKVERRIGRWLGRIPDDLVGGFGPGTCVEYEGANPTVVDKIWLTPTTTPSAAPYFQVLYGRTHWGLTRTKEGLEFSGTSRGNRLTTVPKDGKTDRPICIEPLGNLWLQLGVGRYLKKRLRLCGLPRLGDTTRELFPGLSVGYQDAQSVHRELAQSGRRRGFATIDLSSASDTVAHELVRWVLPPDWFQLLDDLRSPLTSLPNDVGGGWRRLEKFSSMGNGFTFELETLIFLGLLCEAFELTPGVDCWVFGDDIIVPEQVADLSCKLLTLVGFTPNKRKSYLSGPFRESCGGNFHTELDVSPVRVKGEVDSIPQWIAFHNLLTRWGFPQEVTKLCATRIPLRYRLFGPERLGDVVLHGSPSRSIVKDGIQWVRVLKFVPTVDLPLDRWSPELALTAILLGVPPRVVRRRTPVAPNFGWASVS